jgi:hypothetical protein
MTLGSMALVTGKLMSESWRLADWEEQGVDNALRDSPVCIIPLTLYLVTKMNLGRPSSCSFGSLRRAGGEENDARVWK